MGIISDTQRIQSAVGAAPIKFFEKAPDMKQLASLKKDGIVPVRRCATCTKIVRRLDHEKVVHAPKNINQQQPQQQSTKRRHVDISKATRPKGILRTQESGKRGMKVNFSEESEFRELYDDPAAVAALPEVHRVETKKKVIIK